MNLPLAARGACFGWLALAFLALGSCREAVSDNANIPVDNNHSADAAPEAQPLGSRPRWFADIVCQSDATYSIGTAAIVRIVGKGGVAITASHVAASLTATCPSPALRVADDCSLDIIASNNPSGERPFPLDIASVRFTNPQQCKIQTAAFRFLKDDGGEPMYVPARGEQLLDFSYEPTILKVANGTDETALIVERPDHKSTLGVRYSGSPVFSSPKRVLGLITDRLPQNRDKDPLMTQQLLVQRMIDIVGLPARFRSFLATMVPASSQAVTLRNNARSCPSPDTIVQEFLKFDAFDQIWLGQNLKNAVAGCARNYWAALSTALSQATELRLPDLERADLVSVAGNRSCGKRSLDERLLTQSLYYDALGKLFVDGPERGKQFRQSLLDRALCQATNGRDAIPILINLRLILLNTDTVGLTTDPDLLRVFGDSLTRSAQAGAGQKDYIASFRVYELCLATSGCAIKIDEFAERASALQNPRLGIDAPITAADTPVRTLDTERFVRWLCTRAIAIRFDGKGSWNDLVSSPPELEAELSAIEMLLFNKLEPRDRKSYAAICAWEAVRQKH